jgi:integrase
MGSPDHLTVHWSEAPYGWSLGPVADPLEAQRLVAALATPRDRATWATALYAGLRAGELRALKRGRIDDGGISARESMSDKGETSEPKTRAGIRRVPITPVLRRHLSALLAEGDDDPQAFAFGASSSRPFAATTIYRHARKAWADAGVEPITLHECRHSAISTWIASGVNIKVVSTYAGHASIAITLDRYGHLMPGSDAEALARIEAYTQRAGAAPRAARLYSQA